MPKDNTIIECFRELVPEAYYSDNPERPDENYARIASLLQTCGVYIEDGDIALRSVTLRSTVGTKEQYSNTGEGAASGKICETWGDAARRASSTIYAALMSDTVHTAVIVLSMERPRAKEMEVDNSRKQDHVPLKTRNPDVFARLPVDFSATQPCVETWKDIMYTHDRFMAWRVFFSHFLLEELSLPVGKSLIVYGAARKVPQSANGTGEHLQNLFYKSPVMVFGDPSGTRSIYQLPGAVDYATEVFENGAWHTRMLTNGDADAQILAAVTHFSNSAAQPAAAATHPKPQGVIVRSADVDIQWGLLLTLDFQQRLPQPRQLPNVFLMHQISVGAYNRCPQYVNEYVNIKVLTHRLSILTDRAFPTQNDDASPSAGVLYLFLIFLMRGCDFTRMVISNHTTPVMVEALFKHAPKLAGMLSYRPADASKAEPDSLNDVMHVYLDYSLFHRYCQLVIMHRLNKRTGKNVVVINDPDCAEVNKSMLSDQELRVHAANLIWTMHMVLNSYKQNVRQNDELTMDASGSSLFGYVAVNGDRCKYAEQVAALRVYTSDLTYVQKPPVANQ